MNKDEILKACFDLVHKKIEEVNMAIQTANHSLVEEDKSSAGDKYETGREMIQQDLNRYEQQLKVLTQDLDLLQRILAVSGNTDRCCWLRLFGENG
ncbi:hypothetical protein [Sphingobacterium sp. T2]|uniref:hypothetical protein n=1 Tax=Sphingobacterium sp. T2 TaxID=1590596 RepID=UPI00057BAAFA|nr:hypothetical protein [Sphingobacterium sp. T2]